VLLQDEDFHAGAGEEEPEHHPARTAAHHTSPDANRVGGHAVSFPACHALA
jgi:hypothetical protein